MKIVSASKYIWTYTYIHVHCIFDNFDIFTKFVSKTFKYCQVFAGMNEHGDKEYLQHRLLMTDVET